MRREARQAHSNRLLIADLDENVVEDRQLRLDRGGAKPRLVEDHREPDRLQRDGLAARVRPADHDRTEPVELEIDRHGRCRIEQRMSRRDQADIVADGHPGSLPRARERAACDGEVDGTHRLDERG